jgi:DNA-binding MarR family transcriptional regulator
MSPDPLSIVLQNWIEIFMQHSMQNLLRFAKETGFSMSQVGALFFVSRKGSSGVSDIGDELGVTSAAASQMLDRLVQAGLILRSEDPHDRRLKQIVLTAKGHQILQESLRARQSWLDDLVQVLSPAEQDQVASAIHVLIEKAQLLERVPNLEP